MFGQFDKRYARDWGLTPDAGKEVILFHPGSINKQSLRVHILVDMIYYRLVKDFVKKSLDSYTKHAQNSVSAAQPLMLRRSLGEHRGISPRRTRRCR